MIQSTLTRSPATATNAVQQPASAGPAGPQRFDMYASIHKALRSRMAQVLCAVGRLDWLDDGEMSVVLGDARALLAMCRAHLEHENRFVHPAIEARCPGVSNARAVDHEHHVEEIDALLTQVAGCAEATEPGVRACRVQVLYRSLALFVADNLVHMDAEETVHNAALWSAYSDDELVEIHDALIASIPPQEMVDTIGFLVPAIAPAERAGMLTGMKVGMPAEAFAQVLGLVRPHLGARDWAKLEAAIGPLPA